MNHEIFTIIDFSVVAPYTLELEFNDATKKVIDFRPVLKGEILEPLRDISIFNQVRLDPEIHTLAWPNGADFDPATLHDWDLYEADIIERVQHWDKVAEEQVSYSNNPQQGISNDR